MIHSQVRFRSMQISDLATILSIEREAFPDPWTKKIFQDEIEQNHLAHNFVLERFEEVIGYFGLWRVYDEAQITKIAIASSHRGQGWGQVLVSGCMELAKCLDANRMTLEVRVSNIAAQRLYEKMGFQSAGIRPNFYTVEPEDAVIMWVMINETTKENVCIGN
ncbi:[SSU ribosomal protein S18P]-alanine acetyltransferase [Seinonella peptonophila]|uniref:[SSU ribosomal protein S18P]-alanine acetyltransferase n=1 Tax=Seinonella peptonophila TaxID=112248 RepID=A0A1M4Y3E6_9BACL|nr:ribosomal protein S18-alanine N-acetyltransferase [Seinonella peptonophila]SHF00347.1 [SSU ribosomal protein S18P]-alanine acetyltransferase [Seinonella peptonophila]